MCQPTAPVTAPLDPVAVSGVGLCSVEHASAWSCRHSEEAREAAGAGAGVGAVPEDVYVLAAEVNSTVISQYLYKSTER